MPGFATSSNNFVAEYLNYILDEKELANIAAWLFKHAGEMNEAMFFDESVDWNRLDPTDLLTIRACAPGNVFTNTAKAGFLARVGSNPTLFALTDALFGNDSEFLAKLPEDLQQAKAELIQLIQLAYRHGIRMADAAVKRM